MNRTSFEMHPYRFNGMASKPVSVAKKRKAASRFCCSSTTCGSKRLIILQPQCLLFGQSPFGDASRSFHFVFIGDLATDESFHFCVKHLLLLSNRLLSVNSASYDVRWCIIYLWIQNVSVRNRCVQNKSLQYDSVWMYVCDCEHLIHASAYNDQFDSDSLLPTDWNWWFSLGIQVAVLAAISILQK